MKQLSETMLPTICAMVLFAGASHATAAEPLAFERDVLPILNSHCLQCHGGLHRKAELDLRTIFTVLAGGESGKVVTPSDPDASLLWRKIASDEMPKSPIKVSAEHKAIIRRWIADGAKSQRASGELVVPAQPRAAEELAKLIDDAIEKRLAAANIPASPQADDGEFQRRVWLDVVGRIPVRADATAFLEDMSPDKRARLIDRLLASPESGQFWARLWRDRVAVPIGAGEDLKGPYTANFQKWLAEQLNQNRPWDELVRAMISAEGDDPAIAFVRQCMDDGQPRAGKLASSMH